MDWVVEVKGPRGVKQFEVSDEDVAGYRTEYHLDDFPDITDYQIALFLVYDRSFHDRNQGLARNYH